MTGATRISAAHFAQHWKRRLLAVVECLSVTLALAGCSAGSGISTRAARASAVATAGSTPSPSVTPASHVAFSCSDGGLPVTSGNTRTSCSVTTQDGMVIVQATYTLTNSSQLVDASTLSAAGWVLVSLINEDGGGSSGTWFLYVRQGAWIGWGGATKDGMLGIWAGTPVNGEPIGCGRTITGQTSPNQSVPLPLGTQSVAVFHVAPFCLQDVESFYTTTLTAAGWTADGPFQVESGTDARVFTANATFTRNGVSVNLYLTGADGTPTEIDIF
jgi:hypothetical protein